MSEENTFRPLASPVLNIIGDLDRRRKMAAEMKRLEIVRRRAKQISDAHLKFEEAFVQARDASSHEEAIAAFEKWLSPKRDFVPVSEAAE